MPTEYKEEVRVVEDNDYSAKQRIVERSPATRNVLMRRINQFIWLVTTIIVILIVFRFIFKLIPVNPGNAFADLIYGISDVFMAPFATLIASQPAGNGILELSAFVAVAAYVLLAWMLTTLIAIVLRDTGGSRRMTTIERDS